MAEQILPLLNNDKLLIRRDRYAATADRLEDFINKANFNNTKNFSKKILLSQEIKTNDLIEGYFDDQKVVEDIINRRLRTAKDETEKQRIMNLYHGYNYIFKNDEINENSLKKLYSILSKNLLSNEDLSNMGEFYRNGPVYIFYSDNIFVDPDEGVPKEYINYFMEKYFNFLNNNDFSDSKTSEFIKSQILHFYFVYIHPYFDVNGRTSRTLSIWYLLNKKAYPYVIFNRGISFKKNEYYKAIEDVKKFHDISYFIEYMLLTVEKELEKEYILKGIINSSSYDLSSEEIQTILYILSMNGTLTVCDFASFYNRFNAKTNVNKLYNEVLLQLEGKNIIRFTKDTNSYFTGSEKNKFFELNPDVLDYEKSYIRTLIKYK